MLPYIPDRIEEGYGPNAEALRGLIAKGATLILTVDCGSVAYDALGAVYGQGADVIVVDHHLAEGSLPAALAVINPNRLDDESGLGHLCAAGVTFLLLVATNRALRQQGWFTPDRPEPDLRHLLDLVALGTVCDVVPLRGLNRAYVAQGLKVLDNRQNPGLRALADVAGVQGAADVYTLGFLLGPRINAGGRVGKADLGVRLLTCMDDLEARQIALQLHQHNAERQAIEIQIQQEAAAMASARLATDALIVVAAEGWHPGVIGIVAGRLKEQFGRPAAVIALSGGIGKASARSVEGFDLGSAITRARQEGLLVAGGGHAMAAGFTIEQQKLEAFRAFLEQHYGEKVMELSQLPTLRLDGWVSVGGLSLALAEQLEQAGPYGAGWPAPVLAVRDCVITHITPMNGGHMRLSVVDRQEKKHKASVVAFRTEGTRLGDALAGSVGRPCALAGRLSVNRWQGRSTPQLQLLDLAFT